MDGGSFDFWALVAIAVVPAIGAGLGVALAMAMAMEPERQIASAVLGSLVGFMVTAVAVQGLDRWFSTTGGER